ncbi:sensor histidine kinase [Butyrivibrio sp. INlla14]|uniref:sensor histidine kinase n=1 Tax=Butyrivibrio sp. INlla14 TaxID=1520808 RepID=UPI00087748EA|nr:HAMP domain-containing sensor histidine kinase [Butyrivibrio sp. INlla14]SCY61938.1 Signal transduction histidine kinase [Butyrivibrio sp. INlla14]
MNESLLTLAGLVTVIAIAFSVYNSHKNKKVLDHIEKMLADAVKGKFHEEQFSEDRESKIESKLADYLQSSVLSAENVRKDRDKIKTLIADISHQTKTPITNLLLHSELLRETELSDDQRESLEVIGNEAEKLRFLIDALVKLSRLENGILTVEAKNDNVRRLIMEVDSSMRKKAEAKGLSFVVTEKDVVASFDYKWTLEALSNIVDNAIKYTEKGSISITLKPTEMFACISIKDTGIGIAEEDIPKIFARFGRLQSSREKEGVGIGLYLVREIISKEGGYIKVKSTPGEGSEFLVYLKR